eukprot:3940320-Lingulodinium_polyedra.AAC.1
MERARVRFASRCGGRRSIQPHHCARVLKSCAMVRSSRPSAAKVARKSHAALHAGARSHGARA